MPGDYDGQIRIRAVLDEGKVQQGLKELQSKLVQQTREIENQTKAVNRLQAQYDKLVNSKTAPKGTDKLQKELDKASAEAAKLQEQFEQLMERERMDIGLHGTVTPQTEAEIERVGEQLRSADAKVTELKQRLEQVNMPPAASEEAQKLAAELENAKAKLTNMQSEAAQTKARMEELGSKSDSFAAKLARAGSKAAELMGRMGGGIVNTGKRAVGVVGSLISRIRSLGKERGFDRAGKSANRLGQRLKSLVTGALFFNIISRGLTQLTKQVGTYLTVNKGFSGALSTLKGNLLTAFQPIYERIVPALTTLINMLSEAAARLASFTAGVFGTTADKAQDNAKALYDQANATEEAGKAAKDAAKSLASFDTIEILGAKESETSAGAAATPNTPAFETNFQNLKPPEWLMQIWETFEESWREHGEKTMSAFRGMLDGLKGVISDIGKAFVAVWTNGTGKQLLSTIHSLLQTIFGVIQSIAAAFREAWSRNGETVLTTIGNALNNVWSLIQRVGQAFKNAWNSGGGVEIMSTIQSIIGHIFELVGNLASRLKTAWDANNNGQRIWQAILGIIQSVLGFIDRIVASTAQWASTLDFEPLLSAIASLFEAIKPVVGDILDVLAEIYEQYILPMFGWLIEDALPWIIDKLAEMFEWLHEHKEILEGMVKVVAAFVAAWALGKAITAVKNLLSVINPLHLAIAAIAASIGAVVGAWDDMSGWQKAVAVIGAVVAVLAVAAIAIGAVQSALTMGIAIAAIVGGIVAMAAAVKSATSNAKKAGAQTSGGPIAAAINSGMSGYNVPHLAEGAVISPNSEFLAVLGDQKHGRNIETPEALLRQIVRDELATNGAPGAQNVTINFSGSLSQLARVLQPEIQVETRRRGPSLISGGAL